MQWQSVRQPNNSISHTPRNALVFEELLVLMATVMCCKANVQCLLILIIIQQ